MVIVDGTSMNPTLHNGQVCISTSFFKAKNGQIVAAIDPDGYEVVKRMILKDGKVFLYGDNEEESYDSQFYGAISNSQIKGIVFATPFTSSMKPPKEG